MIVAITIKNSVSKSVHISRLVQRLASRNVYSGHYTHHTPSKSARS